MQDMGKTQYDVLAERMYIIQGGHVVYAGGRTPYDFHTEDIRSFLIEQFGER